MSPTPSITSTSADLPKEQKPLTRRVRSGIHNVFHHNHEKCHKDYCSHYERQRRTSSHSISRSSISSSPPQTPPQLNKTHSGIVLPSSSHKSESSFNSLHSNSTRDSTKIDESWLEESHSLDYSVPAVIISEVHPEALPPQPSFTRASPSSSAGLVQSPEPLSPDHRPPGLAKLDNEYFPHLEMKQPKSNTDSGPGKSAAKGYEVEDSRPPPRARCFSEIGVGTQDDLEPKVVHVQNVSVPEVAEKLKVDVEEKEKVDVEEKEKVNKEEKEKVNKEVKEKVNKEVKEKAQREVIPFLNTSEEDGAMDFRRELISYGAFCVCGVIFVRTFVLLFGRK